MQFHYIYVLAIITAVFCWDCPPNQKQQLTGDSFPNLNKTTARYSPNLRCIFEIVVPPGKYINLVGSFNLANGDSLLFTDDSNMYLPYTKDAEFDISTPRTLTISFNSTANTNGSLAFIWHFNNLPFDNKYPMRETVAPSRVGVILIPSVVRISPYVITSEKDDIVLAVASNCLDYKLASTFVFAGEGVSGKYLGSFNSMLNTGYFRCNTKTITVISVSYMDCGMALAKAYSDVKGFNYRIAYDDNLDTTITLDGRTKPDAITIFSNNAENVYLSSPNFSTTTGSLEYQSEDLRPNSVILTSYIAGDSRLKNLPQAMPGYMKTLSTRNAHVTIPVSMDRPQVYDKVAVGYEGIFTSKNFGASKMIQMNSIAFKSEERLKLTFNALEAYNNTVFFVKVIDRNQTFAKNVMARESYSVIGSSFEFSYNVSLNFETSGGISKFQFTPPTNHTTHTPHSSGFNISLLLTAIIAFMP